MHSRANHILGPLSFSDRHLEWFGNDLDGAAPRRRQTLTGNHPLPKPTSLVPCRLHTPRTPVLPLNLFASCSHKHTSTHSHAHLHTQTHTHTLTHMHTRTEFTLFPRFGQETAHCSEAPFSNFVVMSAWLLREEGGTEGWHREQERAQGDTGRRRRSCRAMRLPCNSPGSWVRVRGPSMVGAADTCSGSPLPLSTAAGARRES